MVALLQPKSTSEVVSKGNEAIRVAIVDVAHEALIRHWRLLQQWIEQNRDRLRQQRKIEASAEAWRSQGQRDGDLLQGLPLTEAIQFNQKQRESFPLSDSAKTFIQQSIQHRGRTRNKTLSRLMIAALVMGVIVEANLRETSIQADFARIEQEGTYEEKQAVEALVKGCTAQKNLQPLPGYLVERLFGNCRSLAHAPLAKANLRETDLSNVVLSNADLRYADLRNANLRNADLFSANLGNADLRNADLRKAYLHITYLNNADLSNADLRNASLRNAILLSTDLRNADLRNANFFSADLSNADLSNADLDGASLNSAILLATNLQSAKNLTQNGLKGQSRPLLCGVVLPEEFEINSNQDCDLLPQELRQQYPEAFKNIEAAKKYVDEAKRRK